MVRSERLVHNSAMPAMAPQDDAPVSPPIAMAPVIKPRVTLNEDLMGTYRAEVSTGPGVYHRRVLSLRSNMSFTDRLTRSEMGPDGSKDQTIELSGSFTLNGYKHRLQDFCMTTNGVKRYTEKAPEKPSPLGNVSIPDVHMGIFMTKNEPAFPAVGMEVQIIGMEDMEIMNGKTGQIESFDEEKGRFNLELAELGLALDAAGAESLAQIKPENLIEVNPPERVTANLPSSIMAPQSQGYPYGFCQAFPVLLDLDAPASVVGTAGFVAKVIHEPE